MQFIKYLVLHFLTFCSDLEKNWTGQSSSGRAENERILRTRVALTLNFSLMVTQSTSPDTNAFYFGDNLLYPVLKLQPVLWWKVRIGLRWPGNEDTDTDWTTTSSTEELLQSHHRERPLSECDGVVLELHHSILEGLGTGDWETASSSELWGSTPPSPCLV